MPINMVQYQGTKEKTKSFSFKFFVFNFQFAISRCSAVGELVKTF